MGKIREIVRLEPFKQSSPEGRSKERHRRAALSAGGALAAQGASILISLISVPLTIHYLGTERYGMWMTLSSLIVFMGLADFGVSYGLLNVLSEANGRRDTRLARQGISSAFFLLLGLAVVLGMAGAMAFPHIPWEKVFNVHDPLAMVEAGPAVAIFCLIFLVNLPLTVAGQTQAGYQESYLNTLWSSFGNLLSLAGLLTAIHFRAGLPWLVLAFAASPALAMAGNGLTLFWFRKPSLRPRPSWINLPAIKKIFSLGVYFFMLQALSALIFNLDNFISAQMLGAAMVPHLAVAAKLFNFIPLVLSLILSPLWPAYGEAIARGDWLWVRNTLKRSLILAAGFSGIAGLLLILFGQEILRLWVGPQVSAPIAMLAGMGMWTFLISCGMAVALFLNGAGRIRFQLVIGACGALASVLGKITLAKTWGLSGIVWAGALAYLVFTGIPCLFYVPRILATLPKQAKK